MGIQTLTPGHKAPDEVNVVIEIPMNGGPVKYEVDKDSGMLMVDRFMATAMNYPANYGYIPKTLSEDGDPVDVLVVTTVPLVCGSVIKCRLVGMLNMEDESGIDAKLVAVPVSKLTPVYDHIQSYQELPQNLISSIEHFFSHYKDLEKGKWVKIKGWEDRESAHQEVLKSIERFNA